MVHPVFSWSDILSDLFVNLAAAWFAEVLIETQLSKNTSFDVLILRFIFGILSLLVVKFLRDHSKNYERLHDDSK